MIWKEIKGILIVVAVFCAVAAAVFGAIALIDAINLNQQHIQDLKAQRYQGRYDLCEQLRAILIVATPKAERNSPKLQHFFVLTGLNNCRTYAMHLGTTPHINTSGGNSSSTG